MQQEAPRQPPSLIRLLAALALDYLRWTQLVPMILAWAFLLLMVGAMLLVNFQEQSFGLIERGISLYERIAGPIDEAPDAPDPPQEADSPVLADDQGDRAGARFSGEDFEPLVTKAWALLALAGWLLGMAYRLLFGRPLRVGLKRKLLVAGLACIACTGLFLVAYFFGSERFNGSFVGWLAMFIVIPLIVWCISAYSLAISTAVDLAKRAIYRGGASPAP